MGIDTPGVGDGSESFDELTLKLEKCLSSLDVIIVCSKIDKNRITIGTQHVEILIDKCMIGSDKWDNVILCGMQSDRCSREEKDGFRTRTKDEFNKKVNGSVKRVVVVSCEKHCGGYSELEQELLKLPNEKLKYVRKDLSDEVSHATGFERRTVPAATWLAVCAGIVVFALKVVLTGSIF